MLHEEPLEYSILFCIPSLCKTIINATNKLNKIIGKGVIQLVHVITSIRNEVTDFDLGHITCNREKIGMS